MISIIVPAYNESKRISIFLKDLLDFLKNWNENCELIIVDDGSSDDTFNIVSNLIKNFKNTRIISYKTNMGKGYAVKTGVLAAKGDYIIFIDADGSIPPFEISNMVKMLNKYAMVVGDRSSSLSDVKQPYFRKVIGTIFNKYVNLLFRVGIKDFLCGFKGFRQDVAKKIFRELLTERWLFDVEIFYKARKNSVFVFKMPIKWTHKPETKIKALDPIKMFFQALLLRLRV